MVKNKVTFNCEVSGQLVVTWTLVKLKYLLICYMELTADSDLVVPVREVNLVLTGTEIHQTGELFFNLFAALWKLLQYLKCAV